MDTIISYSRKLALWKKAVGITILIFGIYSLMSSPFALVPILLGVMLLIVEGTEIDLASKTYRKINSVFGIKFGSWQPLPDIEYVSVFSTKERVTARALSAETTNSEDIIVLNLFYDRNKKISAYRTNNIKDAYEVAFHISDALMVDVLDATVKNDFRWLDKDLYKDKNEIAYVS